MTAAEIQELEEWAATRLMEWIHAIGEPAYYVSKDSRDFHESDCALEARCKVAEWHPASPDTGQIWMCVERMRELGWHFRLEDAAIFPKGHSQWIARFTIKHGPTFTMDEKDFGVGQDANPCLAMLLAMRSALTAGREGS